MNASCFYPELYLLYDLLDYVTVRTVNVYQRDVWQYNGFSIVSEVNNNGGIGQ